MATFLQQAVHAFEQAAGRMDRSDPSRNLGFALKEVADRLEAIETVVGQIAAKSDIAVDDVISEIEGRYSKDRVGQARLSAVSGAVRRILKAE